MKKRAYGYIRVSGKGQINGDGFDRQEEAIQSYAAANGFEVVRIFREEGFTGTLADRPALAELLVALEENADGAETVLVERVDRLARDLMVQETILDDFQRKGFNLISATDGELLEDDPTRKLVRQVLGAIAEYDKTMTVLKLKAARDRKRQANGKCEGRKNYGEISPEVVQEIKRLYRKPRGGKRMSAKKIADQMNAAGYTTATGGAFTDQIVRNIVFKMKRGKLAG